MTDFTLERSRNRKKSQYEHHKNSFSTKFSAIDEEENKSNLKLQSNDKLISILGENILKNLKNSTSSNKNTSNNQSPANTNQDQKSKSKDKDKDKDKESPPLIERASTKIKKNNAFDPMQNKGFGNDVNVIFNGKPIKKSEEELYLEHEYNTIELFIKSVDKNKALKQMHESKENNYSSSNLGFMSSAKTVSSKSEEKNTKINLQNILDIERRYPRRDCPCIILSDKINIEKNDNKLDLLIKLLEEYKEIIMEKIFCKNFQDRIILSIYISLSQISLKLYNCTENQKKLNNLRRYICGLTDNIKYDLFNNPNFTLTSINQKFIEIIDIKNQVNNPINNDEEEKSEKEESYKKNETSLNFSSKTNKISSDESTKKKEKEKEKYRWFYDDENEEIIYENFEEFNEFNNDKDFLYGNNNGLFDLDNQRDNILNDMDGNVNFHKNISNDEDNGILKLQKNKVRRNATHKIAFEKKENKANLFNHPIPGTNHKQKNYNFQIIDINGDDNLENLDSDESIDSEEGFYEVHEYHKYDLPKLVFYEEHVKDKEKRKISKNTHVEIRPDQNFLKDKTRIKKLNDVGFKNIITIINKDPQVLPSHELNLNPFEISDFISEREKILLEQKHETVKSNNNISKKGDENISKKSENEIKNESKNNSFLSKSGSFFHEEEFSRTKILNFGNDDEEEYEEDI